MERNEIYNYTNKDDLVLMILNTGVISNLIQKVQNI